MQWQKTPPELAEQFYTALPADPMVARRKMFGCPSAFVNGNMFAGVHQSTLFLRLAEPNYRELLSIAGSGPFKPMVGRPMKGYATVPESILGNPELLGIWVEKAFGDTTALPPKEPKARKPPKAAGRSAKGS